VEELLQRKLDILEKWIEMTDSLALVNDSSAPNYIQLIEDREGLLLELKEIDKQLEESTGISSGYASAIKEAAKDAIEAEKRLTSNLDLVIEPLKKNLRSTKEQQTISAAYSAHLSAGIGSFYDRRK
jgi:hypothetical protein